MFGMSGMSGMSNAVPCPTVCAPHSHYPTVPAAYLLHHRYCSTGEGTESIPALSIDQQTLYFGSGSGDMHAIDASTGKAKWSFNANVPRLTDMLLSSATLSSNQQTLYFGSALGNMYAINASTGALQWYQRAAEGTPVLTRPALSADQQTLYFGTGDSIYATNTVDGGKRWTYLTRNEVFSSPTLAIHSSSGHTTVYAGSNDGCLHAINATDGRRRWVFHTSGPVVASPTLNPDGDTAYVGSLDGYLYAVDTASGMQRWKFQVGNAGVACKPAVSTDGGTVHFSGGTVYSNGTYTGFLYALQTITGGVMWACPGNFYRDSPTLSSDNTTVYVCPPPPLFGVLFVCLACFHASGCDPHHPFDLCGCCLRATHRLCKGAVPHAVV